LVGFVRPKNGRTNSEQLNVYRRLTAMPMRITYSQLPNLSPFPLLHTADEQALLQYYRQLSQTDQGFIRRAAQALVLFSAIEQGAKS
jgi:hypothetical protein